MSAEHLDLIIEPDPLKIAVAAALVALAIVLYRRTLPPLGARRRAALALARASAFLLLVVFLLEPALVSTLAHRRDPVVPVLIDRSRSMTLSDPPRGRRTDRAEETARSIAGLLEGATVEIVPFSTAAGDPLGPADALPPADGEGTDIAGALENVVRRYQGENLAAVVLLTDGRVTRGMTGGVPRVPVPVFAVGYGDTLESAGLSVESVDCPRVTYTGVRERITAVIGYSLPAERTATVRLMEGGVLADEYTSGPLRGEGSFEAVLFWVPRTEGVRRLEISAVPPPDEALTLDNTEQARVSVLKDRLEILCIDRHPDWDMAFLRDMAAASERLRLESAVWSPGRGYHLLSGAPWTPPDDAGTLSRYDLVVIGDGTPFAGAPRAAALREYVERGGGLLLIASEDSPLFDGAARAGLEDVLPLRGEGTPALVAGEFPVLAAADGGEILARLSVPGSKLDRLPPLSAAAMGFEPTAAATVPFVIEALGRRIPFVALKPSGRGMCGVIAGSGLYRWRLAGADGAEAHRVLLSGLVEYLSGGHREPGLELLADRTVYRTGERIKVSAYAADRRVAGPVRGEVAPAAEGASPAATFLFRPDPERPGLFEALLDPLPPGEYVIKGIMPSAAGLPSEGATRVAVEAVSVEMLRTSRDGAYLERIAVSTGGAVVDPDRTAAIARLVPREPDTMVTSSVRSLRGSALLLAAIVAALAAEWLLRKVWGLV